MATYEYRCRACGSTFEERRPMAEADAPATCPEGHADTTRLLSVFAATGSATPGSATQGASPTAGMGGFGGGGGCCGGHCGC